MTYGKLAKHFQLNKILNKDKTKVFLKLSNRYEIREVSKQYEGTLLFWTHDRKLAYKQWNKTKDLPLKRLDPIPFIEW